MLGAVAGLSDVDLLVVDLAAALAGFFAAGFLAAGLAVDVFLAAGLAVDVFLAAGLAVDFAAALAGFGLVVALVLAGLRATGFLVLNWVFSPLFLSNSLSRFSTALAVSFNLFSIFLL